MAVFKDTTITDNGRTLIADALANNRQIAFTRMITSSKNYEDSTDISKLISIDEIKQSVNMSKIKQEGSKIRLNAVFTNSTVNTSYKIQTIGLYAKIGSGNEILYSVTRAEEPDTMPATNGINLATVEIDLITEINNSSGATMLINPSSLVTVSSLVAELEKIIGMEFGGNIQDAGNKIKGKFYYDNVTKFYYECTENTNLTYNDATQFRAISNKPISDKVNNLFEIHWIDIRNNIPIGKVFETTIKVPARPYKLLYSVFTGNNKLVDLKKSSQYAGSEIVVNLGVSESGFLQYSVAKNTSAIDGRTINVMFVF